MLLGFQQPIQPGTHTHFTSLDMTEGAIVTRNTDLELIFSIHHHDSADPSNSAADLPPTKNANPI